MSRGSTFTLYRAYNNFRIDDDTRAKIIEKYQAFNKKHDWGFSLIDTLSEEERRKIEEERERRCKEDIPLMLNLDFKKDYNFDGERKREDDTLTKYRQRNYENFALRDDGRYCDKLLEWDFGSSFDCLIEHYSLDYSTFRNNAVVITKEDAKEMLSAIDYLLGGRWDDNIEMAMNNPWIKIFSEGGQCDSYWKYVYRHRQMMNKKTYRFTDGEINVVVDIPKPTAKKTVNSDDEDSEDDDIDYLGDMNESNEVAESNMRITSNALRAFLESDNWSYDNETELLLVYSSWG